MKHLALTIAFLVLSTFCFSQVIVGDVNINEKEEVQFVQLVSVSKLMSNKVKVYIDYGQEIKLSSPPSIVKDGSGKKIIFNSTVAAINFMIQNGWEYVDNILVGASGQYVYYYNFRRKKE